MGTDLFSAFDDCLQRISRGVEVRICLMQYPDLRQQLIPLLYTALTLETFPKVRPDADFKSKALARLQARVSAGADVMAQVMAPAEALFKGMAAFWHGLKQSFMGQARVAIPVTLLLMLLLESVFYFGQYQFAVGSATAVMGPHGTLSNLSGNVELQAAGAGVWTRAEEGIVLTDGSRIRTAADAAATLTFFNGSEVRIDPGTDLTVAHVEGSESEPAVIVLQQWIGKTWNRVTKLADTGGQYEIQTPSATALVRGTVFTTEVDADGNTRVTTMEGLVSVSAQDTEVFVPAGSQTTVTSGSAPAAPVSASASLSGPNYAGSNQGPGNNIVAAALPGNQNNGTPSGTAGSDSGAVAGAAVAPASSGQAVLGAIDNRLDILKSQYETWVLVAFAGLLLFSGALTLFFWRRHNHRL
ncbi:MAG: FecR domain-containing protein [Chloroflexota bacterium]